MDEKKKKLFWCMTQNQAVVRNTFTDKRDD